MLLAESVPCHPGFNSKYLLERPRKISTECKPNNDHRDSVTSWSVHSPKELEGLHIIECLLLKQKLTETNLGPSGIPPDRPYPQKQRERSKECQGIQVSDCCTPYYNNTSAGGHKISHSTSPLTMTSSRFDEYYTHRSINHKRRTESSIMMLQSCQENPPNRILSETQTAMLDTSSYEMRRNPELSLPSPPSAFQEVVRPMEPYFEPHQFVPLLRRREPKRDSIAAIPRKFHEQRMSLKNDERESSEFVPIFCTNQQSRITRLPSISSLLAFSEPPFSQQQEMSFVERVQLPQPHPSNILPIPQPPLESSAARYSLPYGAMPRRQVSPISICKASLEIGEALLSHPKMDAKGFLPSDIRSHHFSNMADENKNSRGSMRQGHRQIMSDAEKRARKALQQQRRRKHGPTREPRERFSEEEDRWLVMEKRRLEREPNKHWTDLESAHRAKFPNLKDRSLSGLQSRYYRIKKRFPVDPRECEAFSRWDKEVADQFRESTESDGEPEDYEVRDSSMDEDSITGIL